MLRHLTNHQISLFVLHQRTARNRYNCACLAGCRRIHLQAVATPSVFHADGAAGTRPNRNATSIISYGMAVRNAAHLEAGNGLAECAHRTPRSRTLRLLRKFIRRLLYLQIIRNAVVLFRIDFGLPIYIQGYFCSASYDLPRNETHTLQGL